jgi:hypothetical protein
LIFIKLFSQRLIQLVQQGLGLGHQRPAGILGGPAMAAYFALSQAGFDAFDRTRLRPLAQPAG